MLKPIFPKNPQHLDLCALDLSKGYVLLTDRFRLRHLMTKSKEQSLMTKDGKITVVAYSTFMGLTGAHTS
jgi:hypothetical protein